MDLAEARQFVIDNHRHYWHAPNSMKGTEVCGLLSSLISEVERLTTENADLRAENVIIREHWTALEGERDAANALCEEYRGEVENLRANHPERVYLLRAEQAESDLTRARVEGMELAAEIAVTKAINQDCLGMGMEFYNYGKNVGNGIAKAIRARAAKGEQ